jgi:hypothetical protein
MKSMVRGVEPPLGRPEVGVGGTANVRPTYFTASVQYDTFTLQLTATTSYVTGHTEKVGKHMSSTRKFVAIYLIKL